MSKETLTLGLAAGAFALALYSVMKGKKKSCVSGVSANTIYSPAVCTGSEVYCSGQIALDPSGATKTIIGKGDISKESAQALQNLKTVLERSGSCLQSVLRCRVYLTTMDHYASFNAVYKTFFKTNPPARVCVAVKELPLGALVEIECTALSN